MEKSRASKEFVDISLSFEPHPLTKDLTTIKNNRAINNSIKNLIMSAPTEFPFQPLLGSIVHESLFETFSEATSVMLEKEIERTIYFGEPRAEIQFINVGLFDEQNEVRVTVQYKIVGYDDFFSTEIILGPNDMLLNN